VKETPALASRAKPGLPAKETYIVSEPADWSPFRELARRVLTEGARLPFTEDVKALLNRTASEVGISDTEAESALATEAGALGLLREASRRIREGSHRLMDALHRMYEHKDKRDFDSARQEMRNVLAVEVVPYYRTLAQGQLDNMANEPARRARSAFTLRGVGRRRLPRP